MRKILIWSFVAVCAVRLHLKLFLIVLSIVLLFLVCRSYTVANSDFAVLEQAITSAIQRCDKDADTVEDLIGDAAEFHIQGFVFDAWDGCNSASVALQKATDLVSEHRFLLYSSAMRNRIQRWKIEELSNSLRSVEKRLLVLGSNLNTVRYHLESDYRRELRRLVESAGEECGEGLMGVGKPGTKGK